LAWTAAAAIAAIPVTALAAVDSFFWFEGEQGNSTDAGHKGWFEIKEVSFGVQSGNATDGAARGTGSGRANLKEFTIRKVVDIASPKFQQALTTGRNFHVVRIEMRKAGGDPHQYVNYEFTNVLISKINMRGAGDKGPEESLTFTYGGMKVQYGGQFGGETAPAPGKTLPAPIRTPAPSR
jgi:type VI secretion system secreted protein Hcp